MKPGRLFASALASVALAAAACGGGGGGGGTSTAASCANVAESQGVFKAHVLAAVVADYTGPTTASQVPYARGIQTYLKFANDNGNGICGKKIQFQEGDDKYTVPAGQALWKQFTEQTPVYMYFGNSNSSVQDALQEQVRSGDTPVMAQATTQSSLTPLNKNFYEVVETYGLQAATGVGYFDQKIGNGQKPKAVCVSLTVASGTEYCNAVQKEVTNDGGTFLKQYQIAATAVDATPEATQIQASSPNVIFMHGSPNIAITVMKAMDKVGLHAPIVGIFAITTDQVMTTSPKAVAQNYAGIHSYSPAYFPGPGNDEMAGAAKKYGVDAALAKDSNFVNGWVAGKVFVAGARAGAKSTGKVDHNSLRKGLDSLGNFDTGGQSAPFHYSSSDHQGLRTARPYTYDFNKSQFVAVGDYNDYSKYFKG